MDKISQRFISADEVKLYNNKRRVKKNKNNENAQMKKKTIIEID